MEINFNKKHNFLSNMRNVNTNNIYFTCRHCMGNFCVNLQSKNQNVCNNCYKFIYDDNAIKKDNQQIDDIESYINMNTNRPKEIIFNINKPKEIIFTSCKRCGEDKDPRYTKKDEFCSPFCASHYLRPKCPVCKLIPLFNNEQYCYSCGVEHKFCVRCKNFSKNPLTKFCNTCDPVCIKCQKNLIQKPNNICNNCQQEEKNRKEHDNINLTRRMNPYSFASYFTPRDPHRDFFYR